MAARRSGFNKETFKKQVKENVKALFRKTIEEANEQQIYQAVAYTVKDTIIDNWLETQKAYAFSPADAAPGPAFRPAIRFLPCPQFIIQRDTRRQAFC